ncbi:MAG TPA: HAMP domain-containing sensor histidine kinase [Ktedonobacterales bacterium]|nr:HAMP domain-containing sensor histidine kinase [Ktedonobacterales bacterium]
MATARKPEPSSQADDPREEFLDHASHELRTPITALKGHVQLLQRRLRKQEGRESDLAELNKMMYQIERINHHLDIYLSASHIARHKYVVSPTETDLVSTVRRVVSLYEGGLTAHVITLQADDEQILGMWDRSRLEEAISALLANAVKFSSGGEITVNLSHAGNVARIEISDQGIGVPTSERHMIFHPYMHGSNVKNAGAGLGLYIAHEVVRRHGGRIGVRARPGGGSIFWSTLPIMPPTRLKHTH